jgi:hypothetical protein
MKKTVFITVGVLAIMLAAMLFGLKGAKVEISAK